MGNNAHNILTYVNINPFVSGLNVLRIFNGGVGLG